MSKDTIEQQGALYDEHPAMFKNNPLGFILCLVLIPAFGLGLLILLWWYLQTKSSRLSMNDSEILFEKGLLSKERAEISINSVRTIRVKQSFFNRIFGVGTLEIFTAGDSPEIVATGMPEPNRVRELIKLGQNDD
ncbi:PH domain-containing protein [Magnetovirga frankeli]|uniref:PH domain-containing protein n=1 Tax=Magnetovirga frankeli TaxID=947516 RepID=UPI003D32F23F